MYMSITTGLQDFESATVMCALSWKALPQSGDIHPAGAVHVGAERDAQLVFMLSAVPFTGSHVVAQHEVAMPSVPAVMRIDEVCFPVGAIAHRHTHSGAGLRHLVRGTLRIETATNTQIKKVGDSWFEPVATPVRAVALQDVGVASFVRCMIVPASFVGKSTFQLVNPEDSNLPRLQVTHRHIDHEF